MGGVSNISQCYALELFKPERTKLFRQVIPSHYKMQRERYEKAFINLGLKIWSGKGGFYHWCELPNKINSKELNKRLFKYGAAILDGTNCDMYRRTSIISPLKSFFRFSFGPLKLESFDEDIKLLKNILDSFK